MTSPWFAQQSQVMNCKLQHADIVRGAVYDLDHVVIHLEFDEPSHRLTLFIDWQMKQSRNGTNDSME
jgi:hypothetical protein